MNPRTRRRGEPLLALGFVMLSWIGVRAFAWDGAATVMTPTRAPLVEPQAARPAPAGFEPFTPWPESAQMSPYGGAPVGEARRVIDRRFVLAAARSYPVSPYLAWTLPPSDPSRASRLGRPPAGAISPGGNAAPLPVPTAVAPGRPSRWSGDAWMLARNGTAPLLAGGPAPASYGASQAGATIRYAIAPSSRYRPAAYARVDAALSGAGEGEVALGVSARPLPSVPVIALAEVRATRSLGRLRFRPAAMLVTQLPPFALPGGLHGEAYVQGGYVAGAGATPFVDGQFTFDRPFARLLGHQLKLGGGVWGGAQQGAARLDIGPSTRVDLKLNRRIFARLALDYRLHVAGNAQPGSGPALTASAGF